MKKTVHTLILAIVTVVFLVFAALRVLGTSPSERIGRAVANLGPQGKTVVARVNGDPITLEDVEANKEALLSANTGIKSDREAYTEALRAQIRKVVLNQKAKEAGMSVTEEEVDNVIDSLNDDQRKFLQLQVKVRGGDTDLKRNKDIREVFSSLLLGNKLLAKLRNEGKSPQEIEELVAQWMSDANIVIYQQSLPDAAASVTIQDILLLEKDILSP